MRYLPRHAATIGLLLIVAVLYVPSAAAQEAPPEETTSTAAAPDETGLPLRRDNGMLTPSRLTRVGAVLLLGIGLALAAAFALRRWMRPSAIGTDRRIEVIEARRATPQLTLVLVRVGDREFLVGQSGSAVALLHAQTLHNDDAGRAGE